MYEVLRISDSDEHALAARVERALARLGGHHAVSHYTLWYTTRPPVHHAIVRPAPATEPPAS